MPDEVHLDSNVPGNPAYHFTIVPPGTPARAGWTGRAPLVPRAALATRCVTDSVIRLSVGIEDPADLVADLQQAPGTLP